MQVSSFVIFKETRLEKRKWYERIIILWERNHLPIVNVQLILKDVHGAP